MDEYLNHGNKRIENSEKPYSKSIDWEYGDTIQKVIFLDIDGVMKEEDFRAPFKDECFQLLAEIIAETGAEVVLSSSWRRSYEEFENAGFEGGNEEITNLHNMFEKYKIKVAGYTPCIASGPHGRPKEIRTWLADKTNITNICILDDDYFCWNWLSPFVALTKRPIIDSDGYEDWEVCLTEKEAKRAVEILNYPIIRDERFHF